MIYGTLRPCGVVVCDDIWDTTAMNGCSVLRWFTIWNTMDKGVVVYYDIWDTTDMWCSGLLMTYGTLWTSGVVVYYDIWDTTDMWCSGLR